MKKLLAIVCLLGGATFLSAIKAQSPTLRNFSNIEYNGGTQNWCIGQADDHRMIFANNNGLLSFDGDSWYIYTMPNYTNVRSLFFDKETGWVYVGAFDEFGYFGVDPGTYSFVYHSLTSLLPERDRSFGDIWKVHRFGNSFVFRSRHRLFVKHDDAEDIDILALPSNIESSAVINNTMYLCGAAGIYQYKGRRIEPLPGCEALRGKSVRSVLSFNSQLLFATATDGLWLYDGQTVSPYLLDITPLLQQYQIYSANIRDNYLAFGTVRNGLIVKNLNTGKNYFVNTSSGLQNNTVLSLQFDELNNIWLGLDNGISYVTIDAPYRNLLGMSNGIGTGYTSIVHDGKLYMGTNQGLFTIPWPLVNSVVPPVPQPVSGVSGQVWSITRINGRLLCGANNGAFIVNGQSAAKIDGLGGTWKFLPLHDHPGFVLACDYDGFVVLKETGSGYQLANRVAGFNEPTVVFEQDADGSIWVSQWQKGVYHFRLSSDLTRAVDIEHFDSKRDLVIDGNNFVCKIDGKIYVSSVDGFRNYDKKTGHLVKNESFNHVFNTYGVPLHIVETPQKDLWAYKQNYLALAHRQKDGSYKVDSVSYRGTARHLQISLGEFYSPDAGHTIMNADNGYFYVRTKVPASKQSQKVFIRRVCSTSKSDSILFFQYGSIKNNGLAVPHSLNSLRIEFVQPEYRDERAVEYQCFMEHYDKGWSIPQTATYKEYTHLSGGTYIFHVRAHNLVTGETSETQMELRVKPGIFEAWYAYVFYILAVVTGLWLMNKYLKRHAERELKRVREEQERERREQERELHAQQMRFEKEEAEREKELVKLRNQQLEIDLKHKSSELGDSTMNLVRKNDMLQAIDEEMAALSESVRREDPKAKITKKISDIRRGIHSNMSEDNNWEKFKENFDLVYDNFMQKLAALYPDLKRNDLKLCAYLRMGLSSKEMASLLNVSVRSIETARYRLRKKLNMDSGDNLLAYIQTLDKESKEESQQTE